MKKMNAKAIIVSTDEVLKKISYLIDYHVSELYEILDYVKNTFLLSDEDRIATEKLMEALGGAR